MSKSFSKVSGSGSASALPFRSGLANPAANSSACFFALAPSRCPSDWSRDPNHGGEASNYTQGCAICDSCRWARTGFATGGLRDDLDRIAGVRPGGAGAVEGDPVPGDLGPGRRVGVQQSESVVECDSERGAVGVSGREVSRALDGEGEALSELVSGSEGEGAGLAAG